MNIYHITNEAEWEKSKKSDLYEGDTLISDGFIHCCTFGQIEDVLSKWFPDQTDLVVLEINPQLLISPVKHENLEGGIEQFPHIYGPINMNSVISERKL